MNATATLEGFVSVRAALLAKSRPIEKIYIREGKHDRATTWLAHTADQQSIAIEWADANTIEALAQGNTHGGIVAVVGERRFTTPDALLDGPPPPFVAMLDGIEDPYNFGGAVRALYAAGATGLVVRPRNWMTAAAVVARASAGATELIPTAIAESASTAAEFFREKGLTIAVASKENALPLYQADLSGPLFLVLGGEKRGITRSFREQADLRLLLPYGREFSQSVGTVAATGAIAFEVMRQRNHPRPTP